MGKSKGLLHRDDAVLVVIDVQERLAPVVAEHEKLIAYCARLVKFAGIAGLPVVATEQMKLGPTVEAVRGLLPEGSPVVEKISFDCLGEKGFREALDRAGGGSLVLCGIESHICVLQTAISALADYRVQVVADAVSSRWKQDKKLALKRMAQAGAEIVSSEMFMYEVLKKAGTDEFKATLPLVKEPPA